MKGKGMLSSRRLFDCVINSIVRSRFTILFCICFTTIFLLLMCNIRKDKNYTSSEYDEYTYETLLQTFHNISRVDTHPFKYIFDPSHICSGNDNSPELLILVKSDVTHFSYRMGIRKTWGNFSVNTLKLVFLIGYSSTIQDLVVNEYEQYHDLVQEDFIDAYHNNTYKTVMAFNWATGSCKQAKYLLFTDDDYFINVNEITEYLKVNGSTNSFLFAGYRVDNARVFRYIESQWYMPKESYPFLHYPPYVSGGASLLSMQTAKIMANVFPYLKYIYVDDVFLGIAAYILRINMTHDERFFLTFEENNLNTCLAAHGYGSPDNLIKHWKIFLRRHYDNTFNFYRHQMTDIMR